MSPASTVTSNSSPFFGSRVTLNILRVVGVDRHQVVLHLLLADRDHDAVRVAVGESGILVQEIGAPCVRVVGEMNRYSTSLPVEFRTCTVMRLKSGALC